VPWGVVEVGETADVAAVRETLEEAGITAEVRGLLGVQNLQWESATALAFLGRHISGEPAPDSIETDMALYVSMDELAGLDGEVEPWSDWLVRRVLAGFYSLIEQNDGTPFPGAAFL
jgi:NADH pyrophosphatase NudC (nudix superfamily)